jgi:hypothetical protein
MGTEHSPVRKRRSVTIWGVFSLLSLVAAPTLAALDVKNDGDPVIPSLATFAGWAIIGGLILWLGFRIRSNLAGALMILGILLLMVLASRVSPAAAYGAIFGFTVAWFPHCWPLVGTRPSN